MENNQIPQNENEISVSPMAAPPAPQWAAYPPPQGAVYPTPPQGAPYPATNATMLSIVKYERSIKSGRASLLLIFVLSLANFILMLVDASLSFAFSLSFPYVLYGFGQGIQIALNSDIMIIMTSVFSLLLIGFFGLLWLFSKKYIWPVIFAVVLFALDCLLLGWLVFANINMAMEFIIDIIFHLWAMSSLVFLLISKLRLSKTLRGLSSPVDI